MKFDDVIHNNEIQTSRVGGFGGSDAYMFLKVGRDGIGALSSTDRKRIDVAMGKTEPSHFGGNVATESGHRFEEYIGVLYSATTAANTENNNNIVREQRLEKQLTDKFKTFAHADFYIPSVGRVLECKFVEQSVTDKVASKYIAQLTWYYLMGAKEVYLIHGFGIHDPYELKRLATQRIYSDSTVVEYLRRGVDYVAKFVGEKYF